MDWILSMILVKKKNGNFQKCIGYRKLNKCTQKDHFILPFINTIIEEMTRLKLYIYFWMDI